MDDKLKIFWNLEVLVKMSRSKNDGPSLRIEELEIETKIKNYNQEIEEIQSISEEENYDTSAEMADRNIEIITKKQVQVLRNELKEKNRELNDLKKEEKILYEKTNLLRENKISQEKYIESMQERVGELVNIDVLDRYNGLIAETTEKINQLSDELEEESSAYNQVQEDIIALTEKVKKIEEDIAKKKELLSETQAHLENKENYIDKTKKEKNNKKISELESKIKKLNNRLDVLRKDSRYLETKIKDIINNKESKKKTKPYLVELINQVVNIPYINVPTDNLLEEELLRATQARDSFANEIDQKTYNILEADTPEKLRIEFLTERIAKWREQLEKYNREIAEVDNDEQFNYERKEKILNVMISSMKNDVVEFERAYEDIPDSNIGAKASLKAALDEKKEDLIEAEKIATLFRKDEAEDIATATRTIKYECDQINKNIAQANDEIQKITNRLTSKKSGLIDISSRNKDKDVLKELAQIVIDIKHRRQFPETPIEIVNRLEEDLGIELKDSIDMLTIESTSEIIPKDYDEYYTKNTYNIDESTSMYNDIQDEEQENIEEKEERTLEDFNETYNSLIEDDSNNEESVEETSDTDEDSTTESTPVDAVPETEDDIINRDIDNFYSFNSFVQDHANEPNEEESEDSSALEDIEQQEVTEPQPEENEVDVPYNPFDDISLPPEETNVEENIIDNIEATDYTNNEEVTSSEDQVYADPEVEPISYEESVSYETPTTESTIIPEPYEESIVDNQNYNGETPIEDGLGDAVPSQEVQIPLEEPVIQEEYNQEEIQPEQADTSYVEETPIITESEYITGEEPTDLITEPVTYEQQPVDYQEQQEIEHQDIEATDEYINISELMAPTTEQPADVTPEGTEYIELSSDNNVQPEFNELGAPVVEEEQPITEETSYTEPATQDNFTDYDQAIDNISGNINTEVQNSDNIFSSENLENELDAYISSLEENIS